MRKNIYIKYIKRIFDILISIGVIVSFSWFYFIITIFLFFFQGRPIIYKQKRKTLNGKDFEIYKFRSMKVDAEELKERFTEKEKKEYESNYKLKIDKRTTKIGKILRKTSIDELPQFVNILKGDMAFIGPRPIVEKELKMYKKDKDKLLSIKPGLIGYWQAYATEETTYEERMKMELFYVDNASLIFDIKIFFKSIYTVVRKSIS